MSKKPQTSLLVDGRNEDPEQDNKPANPSISKYFPSNYDKYEVPVSKDGGKKPFIMIYLEMRKIIFNNILERKN